SHSHLNRLRDICDLKREIQPNLLGYSQCYIAIAFGLETGQLRSDFVCAGLQACELVRAGLVRDDRVHDSSLDVCGGDRYPWDQRTRRIAYRSTQRGAARLSESSCRQNCADQQQCDLETRLSHITIPISGVLSFE